MKISIPIALLIVLFAEQTCYAGPPIDVTSVVFVNQATCDQPYDTSVLGPNDLLPRLFYTKDRNGAVDVSANFQGLDADLWVKLKLCQPEKMAKPPLVQESLMGALKRSHQSDAASAPKSAQIIVFESSPIVNSKIILNGKSSVLQVFLVGNETIRRIVSTHFKESHCYIMPTELIIKLDKIPKRAVLMLPNTHYRNQVDEDCKNDDRQTTPKMLAAELIGNALPTDRNIFLSVEGYIFAVPMKEFITPSATGNRFVRSLDLYAQAVEREVDTSFSHAAASNKCLEGEDCAQSFINRVMLRLSQGD